MDFVHNEPASWNKDAQTIADTFARFLPAVEPRFRITGCLATHSASAVLGSLNVAPRFMLETAFEAMTAIA